MDTITYKIDNNLYVNLTNRCSNACTFCVRNEKASYFGNYLWLKGGEPTAEDVIAQIPDPTEYNEIVFCGFGEPTYKLEEMLTIARYVKEKGGKVRLNTNGHGNLIHGRDITEDLKIFDGINISLNAPTKEEYDKVCLPHVKNAFESLLEFGRLCKEKGINAWFSVVDVIGKEAVEKCQKIADECGLKLRVREMITNS